MSVNSFRSSPCTSRWGIISLVWIFLFYSFTGPALANPAGGQVKAGQAEFKYDPGKLTVTQSSDRAIINWKGFSIGAGELTRFIQPSAQSAALNRVVGALPSTIDGSLLANGQVFLINPNGVVVGPTGRIKTGSFLASTLDIPDSQFMAGGDLLFSGDSDAGIENLGAIEATDGDILLIARQVENAGTLKAPDGIVGLAAGSEVLLKKAGDERIFVKSALSYEAGEGVTNTGLIEAVQAELKAAGGNIYALAVNNGGAIHATGIINEGGRVLLKSLGGDINNSGIITAREVEGDGGTIGLQAEGDHPSTVTNSGTLDASGTTPGAKGGSVTMTGDRVALTEEARVDVSGDLGGGTVLMGGGYQGKNQDVYNANETFVGQDVSIEADAVTEGDGGEVIVWSDEDTRFYGAISARGGELSGDGGFAEVSGKNSLIYEGLTDLRAPAGNFGTLLLDPENVYIGAEYSHDPASGYFDPTNLGQMLDLANVVIEATGASPDGNILFRGGLEWYANTYLSLRANNSIAFFSDTAIRNTWTKYNGPGGQDGLYLQANSVNMASTSLIDLQFIHLSIIDSATGPFRFGGEILAEKVILTSFASATGGPLPLYQFTMTNQANRFKSFEFRNIVPFSVVFKGDFDIYSGSDLKLMSSSIVSSSYNLIDGDLTVRSSGDLWFRPSNAILFKGGVGTENDLVLVAGGSFLNDAAGTVFISGARRYLIYSTDPGLDNPEDLTARGIYNRTYLSNSPDTFPLIESLFLYSIAPVLTVTAEDKTRFYGDENPSLSYTLTGLIPGDTLSGVPLFFLDAQITKETAAGAYVEAISIYRHTLEASVEGYQFQLEPGSLTISPAPLTITVEDVSRLYGEPNPAVFPVTFSGFKLGEDPGFVTGLSVGTTADQQTDVGNYPITFSGGTAQNYSIIPQNGILTINSASLTITANDAIRKIGFSNPEFSAAYQGLMDWDKENGLPLSGVVTGLTFTTDPLADEDSLSGNYNIVPSSALEGNYNITYDHGTLTIKEPYQLVITAEDKSRLYGDLNPELTVTYFGFEDGDNESVVSGLNLSTTAESPSNVGDYPITIDNVTLPAYYTTVFVDGTVSVNPAPLNISAGDTTGQYGGTPFLTATVDGLLTGDTLSSGYDLVIPPGRLDVGTYPISIQGGSAPNYEIYRQDGTLTVTTSPLTVKANDTLMIRDQPYPRFTVTGTGLHYDDTLDVLSGLNLVPVDQISYVDSQGNLTVRTGVQGTDESTMFINQSGELTAPNYSPITFNPGILTIVKPQPVILTPMTTGTLDLSGTTTQPTGLYEALQRPFGVPPEGQGFIRYAAENFIMGAGLDVPNIDEWLQEPANRGLMLAQLMELLKAPLKEGTDLYQQREIVKSHLESEMRAMKERIANDAVQRYNEWKEQQATESSRFFGLFGGTLETPDEDFVQLATEQYILGAVELTSLSVFVSTAVIMMVQGLMVGLTTHAGTVAYASGALIVTGPLSHLAPYAVAASVSVLGTVTVIASGVVLAIVGSVMRGLQLSKYKKVEDKYANLVNDARNFDIDSLLTGDSAAQEELFNFMLVTAMRKPIW